MPKSCMTTSAASISSRIPTAVLALAAAALLAVILPQCSGQRHGSPSLLILDTDISSDVDDVGAVAVLHGLANQGKVRILGMMISSGDPWSAPCLKAVNTWFGRPQIPIGMIKGASVRHKSKYTRIVAEEFPHQSAPGGAPPDDADAVQLYRRLLASQADQSVTVVTTGYLTNVHNLLLSRPDAASSLDGLALARQKVRRLICMGGQYPSGKEWNFYQDADAAAYVINHWPTPVVFAGFELGKDVLTGAQLRTLPPKNPVRRSYELYNGIADRPSWDQVAVYYAVMSADGQQTDWWSRVHGRNTVSMDGRNHWLNKGDAAADHAYLVQRGTTVEIAALLEQLMLTAPQ